MHNVSGLAADIQIEEEDVPVSKLRTNVDIFWLAGHCLKTRARALPHPTESQPLKHQKCSRVC